LCTGGGVHQTFIFTDSTNGKVVATGSIVADDCDIAQTYDIQGMGFWRFVNVHRDLRGRGIGKMVSRFMDDHSQQHVNRLGKPARFNLFTANPVAVNIYNSLGFVFERQVYVKALGATKDLYFKTYTPAVIG
jgi:GNAT superfamily N-acetyltransferase